MVDVVVPQLKERQRRLVRLDGWLGCMSVIVWVGGVEGSIHLFALMKNCWIVITD